MVNENDWARLESMVGRLPPDSTTFKDFGLVFVGAGLSGLFGSFGVVNAVSGTTFAIYLLISIFVSGLGIPCLIAHHVLKTHDQVPIQSLSDEMSTIRARAIPEEAPDANALAEISQQSNVVLSLDELDRFVLTYVDLVRWEEVAVAAGCARWLSALHVAGQYGVRFEALHLVLSVTGIRSIGEFVDVLDEIGSHAVSNLSRFNSTIMRQGSFFAAVGEDVLVFLISYARRDQLPRDFEWGDAYDEPILAGLKSCCLA